MATEKNLPIRLANSRARELTHSLVPLAVEESSGSHPLRTVPGFRGQQPPQQPQHGLPIPNIFPSTRWVLPLVHDAFGPLWPNLTCLLLPTTCAMIGSRGDLMELGTADLNQLEAFYGVDFQGGSKVARQMAFMQYIG